jgi:oligopeptide transport system substrate-binding protein
MYQDPTAAYNDLVSGTLDFLQQVPTSALAGEKWKTDLGEGRAVTAVIPSSTTIAFPIYDARFKNANLRKAISLAINRDEIVDKIFFKTRKSADSWANPLSPGNIPGSCTVCKFDPAAAKAALQAAGGFTGSLVLSYNADGPHKEWMEATAQSIKTTLGIDARAEGVPTFAVFRQSINDHKMKGPFKASWQQDYPDVENWIGPLYVTGGSSNDGLYSNPQVDALYKEGTGATSVEAAHAKFAEATKLIDADVPAIPMFFANEQYGTSARIAGMKATNVGSIDLSSVEIK